MGRSFPNQQMVDHKSFLDPRTTRPGKTNTLEPFLKVLHTPQPSKQHSGGKNRRRPSVFCNKRWHQWGTISYTVLCARIDYVGFCSKRVRKTFKNGSSVLVLPGRLGTSGAVVWKGVMGTHLLVRKRASHVGVKPLDIHLYNYEVRYMQS